MNALLRNIVPVPDAHSTLTGLDQKTLVIFNIGRAIKGLLSLPLWVGIIIALTLYANAPWFIPVIAACSLLAAALVRLKAARALRTLNGTGGETYLAITTVAQRYDYGAKIAALPGWIIDIYLGTYLLEKIMPTVDITASQRGIALIVGCALALVPVGVALLRATMYRRINGKNLGVAQVNREVTIVDALLQSISLVLYAPIGIAMLAVLYRYITRHPAGLQVSQGTIAAVLVCAGLLLAAMPVVAFVRLRRLQQRQDTAASAPLSSASSPSQPSTGAATFDTTAEQVTGAVYGIVNAAQTSMTILGATKVKHAENTLVATPKGIYLLCIPAAGGTDAVGEVNITAMNAMWNRGELEHNAQELLAKAPLSQIVSQHPDNVFLPYGQLAHITCKNTGTELVIRTVDGTERTYTCMGGQDQTKPLIDALQPLLGDRLTTQ